MIVDPLKKREQFAVSLRKQKKTKLLDLRRLKFKADLGISQLVDMLQVGNFQGVNQVIEELTKV